MICKSLKLTKMYVCTFHVHTNETTLCNLSTEWIIIVRRLLVTHISSWHMTHSSEQPRLFQTPAQSEHCNYFDQLWNDISYSTSRIRTFHTSSSSTRSAAESVALGWGVAPVSGHLHLGRARIAKVGVMKVNVPPWRIGNLRIHKGYLFCVKTILCIIIKALAVIIENNIIFLSLNYRSHKNL